MKKSTQAAALEYHCTPRPGKISVVPTKALTNQRDLSLAYSPGVASACDAIVDDPLNAGRYTIRNNLVGVVTNGTAVLGLGNIGPLAAKPVMEGKAVLFKTFAGIDVFDIELAENDPDKLVDIIAAMEPTFGGINLEDIKAPECFYIEKKLRERMKIPVFHDDQHGTAIVVGAALLNALQLQGKSLEKIKLVTSGAGAAALACLKLLEMLGIPVENIWVTDLAGVVYEGRTELMDPIKARYAKKTDARTLADVIEGADVFLGLSAGGVLKAPMVAKMADKPLIMALANPTPEILPDEVKSVRDDAIIATGRSDFPNQVNNVLCFPFIFRGALDAGATTINDAMQLAAVRAIADLARAEQSDIVANAYGISDSAFGADYIIPKPFDPRLIDKIASAVAKAATESGVSTVHITDWDAYRQQLNGFVWQSGMIMRPVFAAAKQAPKRIFFAEGESECVLRAVQTIVDEGIAKPMLLGRPDVIDANIKRFGLRISDGADIEVVNQGSDPRYKELWRHYHELMARRGITEEYAMREAQRHSTLIGALMLKLGHTDGLICGTYGKYKNHLSYVETMLGRGEGVDHLYAMNILVLPERTLVLCDTYVHENPCVDQIVEMTVLAAAELQRFGISPKIALLSHSNFGTYDSDTALKMRQALKLLHEKHPELEVEGEMHGDSALNAKMRLQQFPFAQMREDANLLIFPTLDAANISFNLLKTASGDGMTIGPILLGASKPVHILTPTATVRRIINMTALAVVEAGQVDKSR